jgi:hypothetical protein
VRFRVLLIALTLATAAAPAAARGAGVRSVVVSDPRPSLVSRPFDVAIGDDQGTIPVMQEVRLEIQGFAMNPGLTTGQRIGSVELYTDEVVYPGSRITTAGDGTYRVDAVGPTGRTSFAVTVTPGQGIDDAGTPLPRPGSTLLSFTVPALPLDGRLQQLKFLFNVQETARGDVGAPTTAVGAANPSAPGDYEIRSWVQTSDGDSEVRSWPVRIFAGSPAQVRARRVGRGPVRVGQPIRLRLTASEGTPTTVTIRGPYGTGGTEQLGGGSTSGFTYYPQPFDRGRTLRFTVSSRSGRSQTFVVRVKR